MSLFRTVPVSDWSTLDDRVWEHPGAVVDLGCDPWDWSRVFLGRKRVIGVDPFAAPVDGAELFRGVIGPDEGTTTISVDGDASTILRPKAGSQTVVPMITWDIFRTRFAIERIAVLKINVEGSEYDIIRQLAKTKFEGIDQIVVSFHDFVWPDLARQTAASLETLKQGGFTVTPTNTMWRWFHCLRYA